MDKKEYITNQLKRTFNKKYENYCITRIYHLLNRNDVQIITQQMFHKKDDDKIALADLYFPQINVSVEIDEMHHFLQKDDDKKRTEEIKQQKKIIDEKLAALGEVIYYPLDEYRIDASCSLENINNQIDNIVEKIKNKINTMGNKFKTWDNVETEPSVFIKRGYINSLDNAGFKTIQKVSELFNKGYKGTQRCWFRAKTGDNSERVWCPKLKIANGDFKNNPYLNEVSSDGKFIYETSEKDKDFYKHERQEIRFVFPKYKDETGCRRYKFKGVYRFNRELSDKYKKAVWEKFDEQINLKKYF